MNNGFRMTGTARFEVVEVREHISGTRRENKNSSNLGDEETVRGIFPELRVCRT